MSRTTVDIDDVLLREVQTMLGDVTIKDAVNTALAELIEARHAREADAVASLGAFFAAAPFDRAEAWE